MLTLYRYASGSAYRMICHVRAVTLCPCTTAVAVPATASCTCTRVHDTYRKDPFALLLGIYTHVSICPRSLVKQRRTQLVSSNIHSRSLLRTEHLSRGWKADVPPESSGHPDNDGKVRSRFGM